MFKKIKTYITTVLILFGAGLPIAPTALVFASTSCSPSPTSTSNPIANSVANGVYGATGG